MLKIAGDNYREDGLGIPPGRQTWDKCLYSTYASIVTLFQATFPMNIAFLLYIGGQLWM